MFHRWALLESVLEVRKYTVSVKEVDYGTIDVFQKFRSDEPLITGGRSCQISCKQGLCALPSSRDVASLSVMIFGRG